MFLKKKNDYEIVESILKGDSESEKFLYNKYRKELLSYIKKNKKNSIDCEDIVSDILVKVFLNLRTFNKEKSNFKSWVFTITRNHIKDLWKKSTPSLVYCDEYFDLNQNTTNTVDNWELEFHEDSVNFFCSENKISKNDYFLLELKYVYGYSYEDMGYYFNEPTTTLSNRVNYIKNKIKKTSQLF